MRNISNLPHLRSSKEFVNKIRRILLIQPYASAVGGVDSVLLQLITNARVIDQSFEFSIVLPPASPYVDIYRQLGVTVYELQLSVFSKTHSIKALMKMFISFPSSFGSLKKLIEENQFDLVHSHKINILVGSIAAWAVGVASIHTYHEVNTGGIWIYRLFNFIIERFVNRIIILTDATGQLIGNNWRDHKKVRKIYNGINTEQFKKGMADIEKVRAELGLPSKSPIVTSFK